MAGGSGAGGLGSSAEAYDRHVGRYGALDQAGQNRLRAEAHRRLDEPDGPFALTARAWWARGLAPGP